MAGSISSILNTVQNNFNEFFTPTQQIPAVAFYFGPEWIGQQSGPAQIIAFPGRETAIGPEPHYNLPNQPRELRQMWTQILWMIWAPYVPGVPFAPDTPPISTSVFKTDNVEIIRAALVQAIHAAGVGSYKLDGGDWYVESDQVAMAGVSYVLSTRWKIPLIDIVEKTAQITSIPVTTDVE